MSYIKFLFTCLLFLISVGTVHSQHTFSIVAVDSVTGEIGSAGATCIDAEDGAQTISEIVLGVGAIHTQSYWDPSNQRNAGDRMRVGDSPEEIKNWLIANDVSANPSLRQYLMVDLNGGSPRSDHYTGSGCFREFISVSGPGYAVAGNILISEAVVTDMEAAFLNTSGPLADRLMAAMNAAKRPGADERCNYLGISSGSAFIRVAAPDDTDPSYGNLSFDLNVWLDGAIFEPIDSLNTLFILSKNSSQNNYQPDIEVIVFPTIVHNHDIIIQCEKESISKLLIYSFDGRLIDSLSFKEQINELKYSSKNKLDKGMYVFSILLSNGSIKHERVVVY